MDEHLRFENAIFCSSNCIFLRFSAHNLSLLLFFLLRGSLYMEEVFRFKSWFLNAPGLIHGGILRYL